MSRKADPKATIKTGKRGEWTRVFAEESDRDVSHLLYAPRELQVGPGATVRMAAIGGVGTDREFRRRGLAGQVFARAMAEIRKEGYSCVALYTSTMIVAHRMYRRFGLADVVRSPRAYKLLDPERIVCDALSHMLPDGSAGRSPMLLRVTLRPHRPVFVRIEEGAV
ncbi:MAG: GNAT family N-acetyltransferase, partial [Armatimonadetes bacterium]|nr:GNAT family N-acetyltransferase [Armatimonadota bacterium]